MTIAATTCAGCGQGITYDLPISAAVVCAACGAVIALPEFENVTASSGVVRLKEEPEIRALLDHAADVNPSTPGGHAYKQGILDATRWILGEWSELPRAWKPPASSREGS